MTQPKPPVLFTNKPNKEVKSTEEIELEMMKSNAFKAKSINKKVLEGEKKHILSEKKTTDQKPFGFKFSS